MPNTISSNAAGAGGEATQVLFTPGMAAGSGTKARPTGRTASRLTPEAAHLGVATTLRFGEGDAAAATESAVESENDSVGGRGGVVGSASPMRALSSISSVSIVTSEAAAPTYSGNTSRGHGGGWGSRSKPAAAGREQEATSRPRGRAAGGGGSKPLFGFLASLKACTRGSDAY